MGRATVKGPDAEVFLQRLTSNDVSSLTDFKGQYSLLCNADGGIKDDVFVFKLNKDQFSIVYNAGNRSKDYEWFVASSGGFNVEIEDISDQTALFAVQGPRAISIVSEAAHNDRLAEVSRFGCAWADIGSARVFLSRTGYTGEDGFEIVVLNSPLDEPRNAQHVWDELLRSGKRMGLEPCGLGARDLLRLEAGYCLYGTDIDEKTSPFEARLGFVVKLGKEFIGRNKLQEEKVRGPKRVRVGLVMRNRVIPRHGFQIASGGEDIGQVTSGTLSPILNAGIAMGYVQQANSQDAQVEVRVRDRYEVATITKTPFYDTAKFGYSRESQ